MSVHDIGAACGISGPALYKHFSGKDELLAASLTDISETLLKEGSARAAAAESPVEALDALIDWHVEFALGHPALIVVQDREWTNLAAAARRDVRALQLSYIDVWVDTVLALRPELDASRSGNRPGRGAGDVRPAQLHAAQCPHQADRDAGAAGADGPRRARRLGRIEPLAP